MADQQACLKMANVRGLVAILQGIKSSHKSQLCTMSINSDGVAVRWEDASKSLQSSVWLSSELFSHYNCPWARKALGLHFAQFVDTLNVFALGSGAELVLRFPGRNEELICEMVEDGSMAQLCTYARIDTVEIPFSGDLMDSWEDPTSFFLMDGALLKETVEDLEWPSGGLTVEVFLRRDPPLVQMSAHGLGNLRVTLPAAKLDGFHCASAEVRHSYKHKHLRTAFTQLPHIKDGSSPVSTKVSIDRDGLMKVTHMVGLGVGEGTLRSAAASLADTQRSAVALRMGIVQVLILADEEDMN